MLLEQTRCGILTSMTEVMKKNLKEVKQHRKAFKEKSDELDSALNGNASRMVRKKETEDVTDVVCRRRERCREIDRVRDKELY